MSNSSAQIAAPLVVPVLVDPQAHPDEYGKLAAVTASGNWFNCRVNKASYMQVLRDAIAALQALDAIKKATWYNRPISLDMAWLSVTGDGSQLSSFSMTQDQMILWHGIVGIATEAGELLEALFDWEDSARLPGGLDTVNIGEELGDVEWYASLIRYAIKRSDADIKATNIAKLKKRYGEKFDAFKAQQENRDLESERKILEARIPPSEEGPVQKRVIAVAEVGITPELKQTLDDHRRYADEVMYKAKNAEEEAAVMRGKLQEQIEENRKLKAAFNDFSTILQTAERRANEVMNAAKIQGSDGNWNYDPYMRGLANGLVFASAVLQGVEPVYFEVPKKGYLSEYVQKELPFESVAGAIKSTKDD